MKNTNQPQRDLPRHIVTELKKKDSRYCLCIPVINEGEKIRRQLQKLSEYTDVIDIILCDGGSTDGSMEISFLKMNNVRALLTKTGTGKLSAQLRMGYSYAIDEKYEGIITVDGNGKDGIEAIPDFVDALEQGFDFVQGSRFITGGQAINTPLSRLIAIKLIHAPFISLLSGFHYTDTTNGYRAYSRRFLQDARVSPFRAIFDTYELLAYLSVKAPRLGFKTTEIPVTRAYPKTGKIPTKISPFRGNTLLLKILLSLAFNKYDPK